MGTAGNRRSRSACDFCLTPDPFERCDPLPWHGTFWVDELAIYGIVWFTFLGASAAIHFGHTVANTILTDVLPGPIKRVAGFLVDAIVLAFALFMI